MTDRPTHWLYPTNESGTYHLVNVLPGEPDLAVSPDNVLAQIELAPDRQDSWYLSTGFRQMRSETRRLAVRGRRSGGVRPGSRGRRLSGQVG